MLIVFSQLFYFSFCFPGRFPFYPREHLINHSPRYNWGHIRYLLRFFFFFFTCTIVTILLRVLTSRVCACSDFWCHRNTSVKHKAGARKVHFSVSRALISRAKFQGKHKEKRLSRQICTKNKTSIRSCQSVKGKLENLLPQTLFEYEFPADVPLCSEFYQKSYAVFKHRDLSARVVVPKGT